MRKPDPVEVALSQVKRVEEARELASFLRNRSSMVVARAALRAEELGGGDLEPALIEAFQRLIKTAPKSDKGCQALTNIAKALVKREARAAEIYSAGIRHIQVEPGWPQSLDAAGALRGLCAIGLVRMEHSEALVAATDLLTDREAPARTGAIRALAESGEPAAELLLRFKATIGDDEIGVTAECFGAIMRLGPKARALAFVGRFLHNADAEVAETAAVALGESRLAEAVPALTEAFARPELQSAVIWAMALLRNDEAIAFLLQQLQQGRESVAKIALQSLAVYRSDSVIYERAKDLAAARGEESLHAIWQEQWS